MRALGAALGAATLLFTGCQGEPEEPTAGDVPTTPRALAWLAAEHLGEPSRATVDVDATEEFRADAVGAELSYGGGQQLVLAVGRGLPARSYDCQKISTNGCEEVPGGVLLWEAQTPEEDPGVVYLVVPKGDATVLMFASGPPITGDPRELDLPISVDEMLELAGDPRVDLTTTGEAVEAGADLDYWESAEQ